MSEVINLSCFGGVAYLLWVMVRPRLGRMTVLLVLLALLAMMGQVHYLRSALDSVLAVCGPSDLVLNLRAALWSEPANYTPGLLGLALGFWLALEINYRFPLRGSRDGPSCRRCGYDLTGNMSGACPECGSPCEGVQGPADERG